MLTLTITGAEEWDDINEVFIYPEIATIELEHSLVSLSKWESKFEKPFLGSKDKTNEEALGYIEMMTLTPNVPPEVYQNLTNEQLTKVNDYIQAKMTATTFSTKGITPKTKPGPKEIITAEVIYYWMNKLEIPVEFQYWHLNRLFTLIEVHNRKDNPPKKSGPLKGDALAARAKINAERKAAMGLAPDAG
jgi:hypothetical protein